MAISLLKKKYIQRNETFYLKLLDNKQQTLSFTKYSF